MLDYFMYAIGIFGVLLIAFDYIMEVLNKLDKKHHAFAIVNVSGSLCLFIYSIYFAVWLFVILNGFLVLVGGVGIYQAYKK